VHLFEHLDLFENRSPAFRIDEFNIASIPSGSVNSYSRGFGMDLSFRKRPKVVGSLGSLRCRREDRPIILLEKLDPVGDVAGMSEFSLDPKVGTEECCGEFGDQLFGCICPRAEPMLEVPVEPPLSPAPVATFVQERGVEVVGIPELSPMSAWR